MHLPSPHSRWLVHSTPPEVVIPVLPLVVPTVSPLPPVVLVPLLPVMPPVVLPAVSPVVLLLPCEVAVVVAEPEPSPRPESPLQDATPRTMANAATGDTLRTSRLSMGRSSPRDVATSTEGARAGVAGGAIGPPGRRITARDPNP